MDAASQTTGPPAKKAKKQEAKETKKRTRKQEPSLSRLTARQLTVARLVSSYKYECKKMLQSIGERQKRWKRELEEDPQTPVGCPRLEPSHEPVEADLTEPPPAPAPERTTPRPTIEEGTPWKQTERDTLRRWFLAFGFDRWDDVEEAVREAQKTNRHTRDEMETACWELLAEVEDGLDGEERAYLSQKLDAVRHRMPFKTPGIPWSRVQKFQATGRTWVRRLQFLDTIAHIDKKLADPEKRAFFKECIKEISETFLPAPWWNAELDLLFIAGVFDYGYGNYEPIRLDPTFCRTYKKSCIELGLRNESKFKKFRCEMICDWPTTEQLNRRLKKVVDTLMKALHQPKLPPPGEIQWSRQEKLRMLKSMMTFGLPQDFEHPDANPQTQNRFLVEMGMLLKNADMGGLCVLDGRSLCRELLAEMEAVTAQRVMQKSNEDMELEEGAIATEAEGTKSDTMVLTPYSAVHLKEQLELLGVLKSHLHLLKHADFVEALSQRPGETPAWWVDGVHDHELLMGTFVHGFGARNLIFCSNSFSFTRCISLFEQTQKTISFEMTAETTPTVAVERLAAEMQIALNPECIQADHIPSARWLTARCKFLNGFMKQNASKMESHVPARMAQLRHQPEWLARLSTGSSVLRAPYVPQTAPTIQPVIPQNLTLRPNVLSVRPGMISTSQPHAVLMLNASQGLPASLQQLQQQLRPGFTLAVRPYVPLAVQPSAREAPGGRYPQAPSNSAQTIFHSVSPQIILAPQQPSSSLPAVRFPRPPSAP